MRECLWCGRMLNERQIKRKSRYCGYSCANKYRYRNVQREYVCRGCGQTYIKKGTGRVNGTKYCSQACGRKHNFGRKFSLEHRRRIADAQKIIRVEGEFHCDRCGRPFRSNTGLRAHRAHCGHSVVLYRCFNCGRSYKGLYGLQRHQVWCIDNVGNMASRERIRNNASAAMMRRIKSGVKMLNRDTKPELELAWRLKKAGVKFEKQFLGVSGVNHCYDFIVGDRVIVEVDGDYWHGNTERFDINPRQKRQFYIDLRYTRLAREAGFMVLRYWASDVLGKPNDVVRDVRGVLSGSKPKLVRSI